MDREELQDLSTEELDELVHDLKGKEAANINNQGREAQIAYLTFDAVPIPERLFVGGGKMPDGSPCPVYCHKCIPKDVDIGDDDIEIWETHSDGWIGVPICSVCCTSIPVVVNGKNETDSYWMNKLEGVDAKSALAAVLAVMYPGNDEDPEWGSSTCLLRIVEVLANHGVDIK